MPNNYYSLYRLDIANGVAIYVKLSFNSVEITDFRNASMGAIWVRLSYYNIVIIYRPLSIILAQTQIICKYL